MPSCIDDQFEIPLLAVFYVYAEQMRCHFEISGIFLIIFDAQFQIAELTYIAVGHGIPDEVLMIRETQILRDSAAQ